MKTEKAFSRLELMAVVVIAAFLLAILLPAGAQMRESAREASCAMNMRQLGICFDMYTKDNGGFFTDGLKVVGSPPPANASGGIGDWLTALDGGYKFESPLTPAQVEQTKELHRGLSYIKDYRILTCPMAPKNGMEIPYSFRAWGGGPGLEDITITGGNVYLPYAPQTVSGSYGHNYWCNNPPAGVMTRFSIYKTEYCWRTTAVENASEVPVLADSYRWAFSPQASNWLSPLGPGYGSGGNSNEMPRVFIDRHDGAINILYMDWSVRRAPLRTLYNIKWHRNWDEELAQAGGVPDFSQYWWMRDF